MDKLGGFHTYLNAQAEEYMISNTDIRYFFDTYYDNFMHSLASVSYTHLTLPTN